MRSKSALPTRSSANSGKQSARDLVRPSPSALPSRREFTALGATATPESFAAIVARAPGEKSPITASVHPAPLLPLQRKLAIGAANEPLESQADARADRVVRGQRSPLATHSSSGRPLEHGTRAEMESRFGEDFGRVRIHTDAAAGTSALAASARAITTGQDIVFGPGFYDPATSTGKRLIAHELAHVIQQNRQSGRRVSRAAAESEARQAGADVTAGRAAAVTGSASVGAQADRMSKEEIERKIAENEAKARAATNKDEIDALFEQRQALIPQLSEADAHPSPPTHPPAAKRDVSVRDTALEIGEHELDKPTFPEFPSKPPRPRDLTSVRLIVKQGTPMRTSVARSHWRSRAEVEQFMRDYITVAGEDPATKSQADEARRDRKLILQELTTAEEDVLAGRLKLAQGQQHVEDVTARLRVPVPEVMKPRVAANEVLIMETKAVDTLIDFVPIVGEIKMALEGITGMTISGQLDKAVYAPSELGTPDLDDLDRIMRLLPIAIAAASKIVSHAPGWAEALTKVRKGTNLSEKALGKALSDTAKLAGREQEIAHALVTARARRRAGLASRLEEFGIPGGKPANTVVPPTEPHSAVIPLRQPAVQQAEAPLAVAAGHDVQAPVVNRPVSSAGGGSKGAPPKLPPVTKLPPGPRPAPTPIAVREGPPLEGTQEIRSRPNQRTQSLSDEEVLRANMEARGKTVPPGHDAHHLVPKKGGGTWGAIARERLRKLGVSINDADNGVALPGSSTPRGTVFEPEGGPFHGTIHTETYYKEIASSIAKARTQADARAILRKIEAEIKDGHFPH